MTKETISTEYILNKTKFEMIQKISSDIDWYLKEVEIQQKLLKVFEEDDSANSQINIIKIKLVSFKDTLMNLRNQMEVLKRCSI